jgi:hypothetical protein
LLRDHDCSSTAAAWGAFFTSLAALAAATIAANFARRAYELEIKPALGHIPCGEGEHKKARVVRYIEAADECSDVTRREDGAFEFVDTDFLNLGRSPLQRVGVTLHFYWGEIRSFGF